MSRRPGASGNPLPAAGRQNEYFVPRDGIDREVITADICRYLGNDALVRPGTYEVRNFPHVPSASCNIDIGRSLAVVLMLFSLLQNPQTGQLIQGYFINAYRNLTTVRSSH